MTPEKQQTSNTLSYIIGSYLAFLLVMTPIIAIGWNVGLQGAEIVDHSINWGTALGLAFVVMALRAIAAGARPTIGMIR